MNKNVINLEDFRVREGERIAKVFTGRDRGEQVRIASMIDKIEASYSEVTIIIPDQVYSINPSFFEEFLKNVVTKLGRKGFFEKFKIISMGTYKYETPLSEAIDRILKEKSAIG